MTVLVALIAFVIVTALAFGLWVFSTKDTRQELIRTRLESVRKAERRETDTAELKLIRDELLSDVPALNRLLLHWSWTSGLRSFLAQAGVKARPGKLILFSAVLLLGGYLGVRQFTTYRVAAAVSGVAASAMPWLVIAFMRHRRFKRFEAHFPEALDLLSRAVRAGHAFSTGLEMIGTELPQPVSGEFRATFEEQNFGLPFRDALLNLGDRVPLIDVRFFITAILIQKETGGNLAEILDTLARVIRERFKIYREVRARTAQGRLSAAILIALPPFMMLTMGLLNPSYAKVLIEDPWGPPLLIVAGILQLLGTIVIWKIVNFEV